MHQLPREEFIERNLGLVHACAGRFKGRGIEYEELYAAGCLGLVKACDGFDTGRGVCFSTYAVPVILGEIKKLFRDGGTVKVSRSLKELSLKINAERERCLKRTGQEPGVTELAETLGTTPEQIALAIRAALPTLSLTPVDDEDGLREFDVPVESPEEALSDLIGLAEVMDRLDSGDRQLIRLRFFAGRTQSETARVLGTTQVQISRRERRILEYLVANRGRRLSKTQIFNAIYGIFDEDVEENVVESHISKLRKKLRKKLGFDPIDSKRFLGYCIDWQS